MAGLVTLAAQSASPPRPAVAITPAALGGTVWPADFNKDGVADLVGTRENFNVANGELAVVIGTGGGGFGPVRAISSSTMTALVVGDFNGDGNTDILGRDDHGQPELTGDSYFFAGNGNGTFAPPVLVLEDVGGAHAQAADFNADGDLDVAIVREGDSLEVHPGHGDGTFGPPSSMVTGLFPDGMVAADLNHDNLPDIAVGARYGRQMDVFINRGGLLFTTTSFPLPTQVAGITAWDLNGDGHRELITGSFTEPGTSDDRGRDGVVYVFRGNGDGTFAPAVTFPTGNDPKFVVAGDFNRDGVPDIATGNRSDWYDPRCDGFNFMPHSVSILPGRGDGTLASPATFTLGPYPDFEQVSYVQSLKTTDINGDGRTDLIASGTILLNAAPRANRAPVADAGPDREGSFGPFVLRGSATDPDHHWLRFTWTNEDGQVLANEPTVCTGAIFDGPKTFSLRVADSEGGADSDSVTVAFAGPGGPHGAIDIGNGGAAGSSQLGEGGEWILTGAGADIWGTADEFHYQAQLEIGDFDATVRVVSVENVHQWTKAGLMLRESFDPGSRHAFVFATPTTVKGIAFQRRPVTNGASVHTAGPAAAPPAWLRLSRRGDTVRAYYAASAGDTWALIGEQVLTGLPRQILVGLAVTSHVDGVPATATFEHYSVTVPALMSADIGNVGQAGTTTVNESTITIEGGGADIWGTADAFRYHYRRVSGNAMVQVDVDSIEATHAWSKAGVMFRESLSQYSKHVMAIVSAGKGVAMQYRPASGGISLQQAQVPGTAPRRLVLQRKGDQFNAWSYPVDGGAGVFLGSVTVPMAADVYVGIPVTAHNNATLATGVFRNFSVSLF